MPSREEDIKVLLRHASRGLSRIERKYKESLHAKSISDQLKVDIKNFCENLRSALEYLACDIREAYCRPVKRLERFYFPIVGSYADFENRMHKWFPDLNKTSPDLWNYLESIQSYNGGPNEWLCQFNDLNNKNKHQALVEQT